MTLFPRSTYILIAFSFLMTTATASAADKGPLRAGAARVDVTLPVNPAYPPSGRFDHEKLNVRAIVVTNGITSAALIGADISGLSEDIWNQASKQIADELKCPKENILMSATHTHSAVPAGPVPQGPPIQFPTDKAVNAMVQAVREAKGKLQPAKVGFGTGFSYLNVNRDSVSEDTHTWTQAPNLNYPSDKTIAVVTFLSMTGEPIAAYINYAMHPINGYLVGITSADFPGAASRYIEQQFDDRMVAVWTQGASGDQNPLLLRPSTNAMASKSGVKITGFDLVRENVEAPLREGKVPHGKLDPKVAERFEKWIEAEGTVLGEEVIRVMTNTKKLMTEATISGGQANLQCPGRQRTNAGREGEPGTYKDSDPVDLRLSMVGIGDIALTGVNAEIFTMISQRMKKGSPLANTMMVTLANGRANSGYVPNDTAFGENTFQVLGSRLKPGCAEPGIAGGLDDLVSKFVTR